MLVQYEDKMMKWDVPTFNGPYSERLQWAFSANAQFHWAQENAE